MIVGPSIHRFTDSHITSTKLNAEPFSQITKFDDHFLFHGLIFMGGMN